LIKIFLFTGLCLILNLTNFENNSFDLLMLSSLIFLSLMKRSIPNVFINFSFVVHEETLSITNELENDFENNLNFLYCVSFLRNVIFEVLNIRSGKRRHIINNIFQNQMRKSFLSSIYMLWDLWSSLIMLYLSIDDFNKLIDQYTVAENVHVVTIRQRRNSDTYLNDSSSSVIIDEWEELEVLFPSLLNRFFY